MARHDLEAHSLLNVEWTSLALAKWTGMATASTSMYLGCSISFITFLAFRAGADMLWLQTEKHQELRTDLSSFYFDAACRKEEWVLHEGLGTTFEEVKVRAIAMLTPGVDGKPGYMGSMAECGGLARMARINVVVIVEERDQNDKPRFQWVQRYPFYKANQVGKKVGVSSCDALLELRV